MLCAHMRKIIREGRPPAVEFRGQTYTQWCATLQGITRDESLDTDRAFFKFAWLSGMRPADARDKWRQTWKDNEPSHAEWLIKAAEENFDAALFMTTKHQPLRDDDTPKPPPPAAKEITMKRSRTTKKAAKPKAAKKEKIDDGNDAMPVDEQLRRWHSVQKIGQQVADLDKKLATARRDVDSAKADLSKARQKITTLINEREDQIAEQTNLSLGKFSERLSFPPPPEMAPTDTAAARDRLYAIAKHLLTIPESYDPEFQKLTDMERRLLPKKAEELTKEGERLIATLRQATKDAMEIVAEAPGKRKGAPLLELQLLKWTDGKYSARWECTPRETGHHYHDVPAKFVPDQMYDLLDELESELESEKPSPRRPQETDYLDKRETFNERDAAIRDAIATLRRWMGEEFEKPSGDTLVDLQVVEARLRQVDEAMPPEFRGDRLLILESDVDASPLVEQPVDAGGRKKKGAKPKPVKAAVPAGGGSDEANDNDAGSDEFEELDDDDEE